MATLPAGQSRIPLPRAERGTPAGPGGPAPDRRLSRALSALAALVAAAVAVLLAQRSGVRGASALGSVLLVGAVAVALFGITGFGVTRLLLPNGLRRHELLWVLPTGACTTALALTVLGYLYVPFPVSLTIVLLAGVALAAHQRGHDQTRARGPIASLAWPAYLAALLAAVALIPLFRAGLLTVVGQGSDAHLAAGTAQFLQHSHPLDVDISQPVDRLPLQWRSKPPIYYALAAVSSLSGHPTFQALSTVAAIIFALTALGWFLFTRELFGAPLIAGLGALLLYGLERMVLHMVMHPYFNQTWGYFTLPFALVLAWWAVHERSRGAVALLVIFLAVGAAAYPLAAPVPVLALAVFWWRERRERGAGRPRISLTPRALLWAIPLAAVLAALIFGVFEKITSGFGVLLNPAASLATWAGDVGNYLPTYQFFPFGYGWLLVPGLVVLAVLAVLALRERPSPVRWGIGAVLLVALVGTIELRLRDNGQYFHFKLLTLTAPVLVATAAAGAGLLRRYARWAPAAVLAVLVAVAVPGALAETKGTFDETPPWVQDLRQWSAAIPADASVRLDIAPDAQLWAQYMLAAHPTCSELPLLDTAYPHVPFSSGADYALVEVALPPAPATQAPADAASPKPLFANRQYALYKLRPTPAAPDTCSREMVQTVTSVPIS